MTLREISKQCVEYFIVLHLQPCLKLHVKLKLFHLAGRYYVQRSENCPQLSLESVNAIEGLLLLVKYVMEGMLSPKVE